MSWHHVQNELSYFFNLSDLHLMRQAEPVSLKLLQTASFNEGVLQREAILLLWEIAVWTQFKAPLNVAFNQCSPSQAV